MYLQLVSYRCVVCWMYVLFLGSTNGDTFYDFIEKHLLPHLMPFDGINPHSVVIMDNCAIHHAEGIVEMIEDVGAIVQFLPPYSPDLMPIEETFSKVKLELKTLGTDFNDIETLVLAAFATVTPQAWIANCNIY